MFQTQCTAQTLPTATTAKRMWYSVSTLSRPQHEISLATVCKMHAAATIPDANSLPDASRALFRITRKRWSRKYNPLQKCTPTFCISCIFNSWVYEMHRPDYCNPGLSYCFMLTSWCCNYVTTDFVNNYVCITFLLLGYNYVCYYYFVLALFASCNSLQS